MDMPISNMSIVLQFCRQHNIGANYVDTLQNALRQRVVSPRPLFLLLGKATSCSIIVLPGLFKYSYVPCGRGCGSNWGIQCVRR